MRPTPLLGEQTAETMAEVGYSADEIQALHDAGIVKTETPNE
jgi:crotonobetainyl-CoA:carnitine CoA-transferase CaiB-like acyl-CoA transferase